MRNIFTSVLLEIICLIISLNKGTITVGIIGLNTGKYDKYCFDKNEKEKTVKIKKILKVKR